MDRRSHDGRLAVGARPAFGRYALWASLALVATQGLSPAVLDAQGGVDPGRLSPSEQDRLERGHLVTRPATERRGPLELMGGTSFHVVEAPAEEVWRALNRPSVLGAILPGQSSLRLVSMPGEERGAIVRHEYGPIEAEYRVRLRFVDASKVVLFRLDDRFPSPIRAGWGFLRITPRDAGTSVASWGVMVDPGDDLLTSMLRRKLHISVLHVPRELAERFDS